MEEQSLTGLVILSTGLTLFTSVFVQGIIEFADSYDSMHQGEHETVSASANDSQGTG